MKKANSLFAFLLILMVLPSLGQSKDETEWYVGVGGGVLSTFVINPNYYLEPELNGNFTLGYAVDLNAGFDYNEHFGFKLEAGFAALGQKFDGTQYNLPAEREINLNYIQIPFMMKYRVGGEKVKFYAMGGPQLGILISAKQDYKRGGVDAPPYVTPYQNSSDTIDVSLNDIKDRYTSFSGAIRVDLGVELTPFEKKHLMIDIGLTSAYTVTDLNSEDWRMQIAKGQEYQISHNFYVGLNIGIHYRW